jgi:redox-sensitive bicupin YhaK (pirin superfamily)
MAELDNAVATVLVGGFAGATSPARHDTPLVGVDGALRPGRSVWPLEPDFEHALVVLDGQARVQDTPVGPGQLAYLGRGRDRLELAAEGAARVLLLGGEPFEEPILMWWNFVARTREEIVAAATAWRTENLRFGRVDSPLARLRLPPLPWPRTPRG